MSDNTDQQAEITEDQIQFTIDVSARIQKLDGAIGSVKMAYTAGFLAGLTPETNPYTDTKLIPALLEKRAELRAMLRDLG